jgi:hypothetical protein
MMEGVVGVNDDARGRGWQRWHASGSLRVWAASAAPSSLLTGGGEVHGVGGGSTTATSKFQPPQQRKGIPLVLIKV